HLPGPHLARFHLRFWTIQHTVMKPSPLLLRLNSAGRSNSRTRFAACHGNTPLWKETMGDWTGAFTPRQKHLTVAKLVGGRMKSATSPETLHLRWSWNLCSEKPTTAWDSLFTLMKKTRNTLLTLISKCMTRPIP